MDLFLTNMQILASQDVNWWTGVVWNIVMFLSAVWTLILTAPIHCRGSIAEQVMECYISPNLMKKQTHLHIGWPEGEHISSKFLFLGELFFWEQPSSPQNKISFSPHIHVKRKGIETRVCVCVCVFAYVCQIHLATVLSSAALNRVWNTQKIQQQAQHSDQRGTYPSTWPTHTHTHFILSTVCGWFRLWVSERDAA